MKLLLLSALQVIEISFVIFFMFLNIIVSAYIIGTITLVVVRGDERTREYRDRMSSVQVENMSRFHTVFKIIFICVNRISFINFICLHFLFA